MKHTRQSQWKLQFQIQNIGSDCLTKLRNENRTTPVGTQFKHGMQVYKRRREC